MIYIIWVLQLPETFMLLQLLNLVKLAISLVMKWFQLAKLYYNLMTNYMLQLKIKSR